MKGLTKAKRNDGGSYEPLDIPLDPSSVSKSEMHEARKQAVALLQHHFWLGVEPPVRGGMKRTVAAELSIWGKLAMLHGPVQVNGAISVARNAMGFPPNEKISLLLFNGRGKRHYLNRCISEWERRHRRNGGTAKAGALLRRIMEGSGQHGGG